MGNFVEKLEESSKKEPYQQINWEFGPKIKC